MNTCEYCGKDVGATPADMCGPEDVNHECRCCGMTLIAKAEPIPLILDEDD